MAKRVNETPYLPISGRAYDIQSLNGFDQDLSKALFFNLSDLARRANGSMPKDGTENFTGTIQFETGGVVNVIIGGNPNGQIELGKQNGVASTPFVDFHSGTAVVDYDARIIASGGDGTVGGGILTVDAASLALAKGRVNFPVAQNPSTNPGTLDDYKEGSFTPTISFATPGNLAVTYVNQMGQYIKIGKQVTIWFGLTTATFTHTTASGQLQLSGFPFTSANIVSTMQWIGAAEFGPLTLAGHTWVTSNIQNNVNFCRFVASGNGLARAALSTGSFPTGTNFTLYGSLTFEASA